MTASRRLAGVLGAGVFGGLLVALTLPVLARMQGEPPDSAEFPVANRIAVVDVSEVYRSLEQTEALLGRQRELKKQLERLNERLSTVEAEIELIDDLGARERKLIERVQLQLSLEAFQRDEVAKHTRERMRFVDSFRSDVEQVIRRYAVARDLDKVIEKRFVVEGGSSREVQWPIVHYTKPEFDITGDISLKINDLYRK